MMTVPVRGCLGFWGTWNMIIYFKGTRDIFRLNLREQGIHVNVSKGTLTTNLRVQQRNLLLGNKGEKVNFFKGSREHAIDVPAKRPSYNYSLLYLSRVDQSRIDVANPEILKDVGS